MNVKRGLGEIFPQEDEVAKNNNGSAKNKIYLL